MLNQSYTLALLNDIFILFFVFIALFTFKGFVQALVAKLMHDDTGQKGGFLSLNPLAHVNIFGLVTVLVVYFAIASIFSESIPRGILFIIMVAFGAHMIMPVPIDDRNFKHHKLGGILTALAGPFANFSLAMCAILIMRFTLLLTLPKYVFVSVFGVLKSIIDIAVIFGVIDLIPLPPFDGGKLLRYIFPESMQPVIEWLEAYSFIILVVLFFAPIISDGFFAAISVVAAIIKQLMLSALI
jgi:Zn-dependent protease